MNLSVEKWHGAGNDFVVLDAREGAVPSDWLVWTRAVCDRRRGIGGDGILALERDEELDFRMHYRNADGGEAEMCGNGGRVLAAYAVARGLGRDGVVRFRSRWGAHEARVERRSDDRYHVSLTLPDVPAPKEIEFDAPWGTRARGVVVHAGVPHLVIALSETPAKRIEDVDVKHWGPPLRRLASLGAPGANVDFVERLEGGVVALRTFERGVEGETLACGTGATATVAAATRWDWCSSTASVRVASGDVLDVHSTSADGALRAVVLSGPAVRVFRTEFPPNPDPE